MIARELERAAATDFDLVVIGGGAYGVTLTLEAARRGLRPCLLERADFGGATSWHSLRIVHGGLRYLQRLDLPRFRESVAERSWLLRHFPDQVAVLPCLMPLYGTGLRWPAVLRLALAVNDLLSAGRNRGLDADRRLPRGRVLDAAETVARFPQADRRGLRGGALWFDGAMPDSQRLLIEMLHWACACGATALSYVEALALRRHGREVTGVEARDLESGATLALRAPVVVNCAGPWCRALAARLDRDVPALFHRSIAFNVLLDRPPLADAALAVTPRGGGRTYFLHPWKGRILAGTYHAPWHGSRAEGRVDGALIARMLADLAAAVPGFDPTPEEVLRVHWGFLPARAPGSEKLAGRAVIRHHGDHGGPRGLFSVSGVKYTTARHVAERTLARLARFRRAGRLPPPHGPGRPPPAHCPSAGEIEALLDDDPAAAARVARRLRAEESVRHLADLVLRRSDWGADPRRGRAIGARLAAHLGWDDRRRDAELARLDAELTGSRWPGTPGSGARG